VIHAAALGRRMRSALGALALAGCATSLLSDHGVRPAAYQELVARTVEVRGLPLHEQVPARVIDQAEVPVPLRAALEAGLSPGEIAAYQDALVAIGLWPEGRSLVDEYLAVAKEEVIGFYVPEERVLYIVRDANIPFWGRVLSFFVQRDVAREVVIGHEVIHALQHQNYPDLVEHERFLKDQDDLDNALQATIEGDATFFSLAVPDPVIPAPQPAAFREEMENDASARAGGALAGAPLLLREGLYFPYTAGYALSFAEHGSLLDDPPVSTEQVLHPERRHEPFEALDLGAGRNLLPAGCTFVHENAVGEFGLSILLRDLAPREAPPDPTAWEGWNGDRYLVARCNGEREFLWLTLWDSAQDAREFEAAYRSVLLGLCSRAGYPAPPSVRRLGSEVLVATPGLARAADAIASGARRAQVSNLRELFAFYGEPVLGTRRTPAP